MCIIIWRAVSKKEIDGDIDGAEVIELDSSPSSKPASSKPKDTVTAQQY